MRLGFVPDYKGEMLCLNKGEFKRITEDDTLHITRFRFYISNICVTNNGALTWKENNSYHLVDASDSGSLYIMLSIPDSVHFNNIAFVLGVDSITNTKGAGKGDLDATNGMYWAWHSGYINIKLEGRSQKSTARKKEFQLHLGGFRKNENCEQKVILPAIHTKEINIGADVSRLLDYVKMEQQSMIMTPGIQSVKLSEQALNMFYILP